MPWFWLVWALSAPPPSSEERAPAPRRTSTQDTDATSDDRPVRRVAFDEPRRPVKAADLRDPFAPAPAPASTSPQKRPSSVDLKDPFGPTQRRPPRNDGGHAKRADLRDPFEARPAPPRGEAAPPPTRSCPTTTTPTGVPIQRPRALRIERVCTEAADPPLRDPFPPPQRPSHGQ